MWWEIRVAGRLPTYWAEWFDGFTLKEAGETVLTGRVPDQAALIGVLSTIHRLNLALLSARRLDDRDGGGVGASPQRCGTERKRGSSEMRNAVRTTVSLFGIVTGFSSIQHGYYEMIQGHLRPDGIMISSYGPPCQAEKVWHSCEPAMTVIPDFFWAGILSMLVGVMVIIWAAAFMQRKHGGVVLVLLSVAQLLVGGGVIPPIMGVVAGLIGTRIHVPVQRDQKRPAGLLARVWPWSLAAFVLWMAGMYPLGHFFNDWLMTNGYIILVLIPGLMILAATAAFARDGAGIAG